VIQVADCVPVLLADPVARLACAVHAGRRGFLAGIVPLAVRALEARGAVPARVRAAIGPCVCGRCYEVPAAMAAAADRVEPGCAARTSWGTPSIDLPAGVAAQLAAAGVRHVDVDGRCTLEDRGLFSYRRDGRAAGRQAGVIELLAV
jgi:YfiH family protein